MKSNRKSESKLSVNNNWSRACFLGGYAQVSSVVMWLQEAHLVLEVSLANMPNHIDSLMCHFPLPLPLFTIFYIRYPAVPKRASFSNISKINNL